MAIFLGNAWLFGWILIVAVILRSLRSASDHDEEFESSADRTVGSLTQRDRPSTWHQCPHKIFPGGHAA